MSFKCHLFFFFLCVVVSLSGFVFFFFHWYYAFTGLWFCVGIDRLYPLVLSVTPLSAIRTYLTPFNWLLYLTHSDVNGDLCLFFFVENSINKSYLNSKIQIPGSVPSFWSAPNVNEVYSGLISILHPSFREICSKPTNIPSNDTDENVTSLAAIINAGCNIHFCGCHH